MEAHREKYLSLLIFDSMRDWKFEETLGWGNIRQTLGRDRKIASRNKKSSTEHGIMTSGKEEKEDTEYMRSKGWGRYSKQ